MAAAASGALCEVTLNAELGFGMPALEAAAQACTFICPRTAGIAAYFQDGDEAFYFSEGDSGALGGILRRLIESPEVAHRAGLAAWERARTTLTWRHNALTVLSALQAALVSDPAHG